MTSRWVTACLAFGLHGCLGSDDGDSPRGSEGPEPPGGEAEVESMAPNQGPWGTRVILTGDFSGGIPGFSFTSGHEVTLNFTDVEDQMEFRVPFPAEGTLIMETNTRTVEVGEFTPTWQVQGTTGIGANGEILSSLAPASNHVAALLHRGGPPVLIEIVEGESRESSPFSEAVVAETARLYSHPDGNLRVFALSDESPPRIAYALRDADGNFTTLLSDFEVTSDAAVAGSRKGGVVWFLDEGNWFRARSTGSAWAVDSGPVADPDTNENDRTFAAAGDGSLYFAHSVGSGSLFDDMERPVVLHLHPDGDQFASTPPAGHSVDDYITDLRLEDRGDGVLMYYCGSDVDPLGLTQADHSCFLELRSSDGTTRDRSKHEGQGTRHGFAQGAIFTFDCASDELSFSLGEDDVPEPVAWPCPALFAAEIDPGGMPVGLVDLEGDAMALTPRDTDAFMLPPSPSGGGGGAMP